MNRNQWAAIFLASMLALGMLTGCSKKENTNEEQGTSILLVEQNAKVALETAHYGYVLEIGRVVMNDTCERLMNSKDIQEFYLGAKEEGARGERRWKKKKTWR